jgi:hypothetical protein
MSAALLTLTLILGPLSFGPTVTIKAEFLAAYESPIQRLELNRRDVCLHLPPKHCLPRRQEL